ncbi:Mth938-like domain-containing protein [Zavarzinia compransoris]|uniref:Mth938-like domain-containing protein n=1 Tax=Zavarzinia marina TaxID=2911065 RepID=UPI001F38E2F7|nr:Mth938-like domain-containing protein [Zavarzinia marina]MCF4164439.1 Mth938-like domain-containing protein [Zavarzinia marina]
MALRELDQAPRRIERYGAGGFHIEGERHEGALLLTASILAPLAMADATTADAAAVAGIVEARDDFEMILIGTGPRFAMLAKPAREALRAAGVRFDVMDTGAACRTYNVLAAEGRRVAAALLPVP